ncbi:MAG TPA: class I SAM-dependent methyltransferase [Pyrinomonadaceae bacterium]|nr:class I SAM-dependent methyltransferase [Pyrinomonadaceae bacterium]
MTRYRINPYISFIESRLVPDKLQRAVFHRLTNEIIEPGEGVRSFLQAASPGNCMSLSEADLVELGESGNELKHLIHQEFLVFDNHDPLARFCDHYVVRPIQNPAVAYRSKDGDWILVRTSMEHTIYSPKRDELPFVIEEKMSPLIGEIFLLADGTKTLQQIFATVRPNRAESILQDSEFRTAIDWLTTQDRQLIKFTLQVEDLDQPFKNVNIVPRNLYHSDRWDGQLDNESADDIIDFHLLGIEDASWEFDLIEPTINHCYRFPHDALGGSDYGSSFCIATLKPDVLALLDHSRKLDVLEIGGGTGSFAKSFIEQAKVLHSSHSNGPSIKYHILDLSPALLESQRRVLSHLLPETRHFQQDATEFDMPDHLFDLIIANEVVADFPVASVRRKTGNEYDPGNGPTASKEGQTWQGDGVYYLEKYDLFDRSAPSSFVLNAGAFRFIERAWKHLRPGGTLILSEYGSEYRYPACSFHLNHDEFSIHFGHLAACAVKVGFHYRLTTLKEFLSFNDELPVLNGREEHILCLNHVLKNYGTTLPFAVISESQFERQCEGIAEKIGLTGHSFAPVKNKYHFGPNIEEFLVLILSKPR